MSGLYAKKRKRPEMNLVPLIDVLVMLIFFAFVTMQFRSAATLNVTLPKVETAGKSELQFSGADYVRAFLLPNFYFHLTIAYGLLRHKGVPLGKLDFLRGAQPG